MAELQLIDGQLTHEMQTLIDRIHGHLVRCNYYELLGIAEDASEDDLDRAFQELQRLLAPEVWMRQPLGHYKARLDSIHFALRLAHQTLKDTQQRARYDQTLRQQREQRES